MSDAGWLRLKQIALVATELQPVLDDLEAVFGLQVAFRDPMVADWGLENAVLPVGQQFIEVVAPVQEGTSAGRYLQRRNGPGGYMVITQCENQDHRRRTLTAHGVRTAFEFSHEGFRCLQLHPADTGGAFFEIDEQADGERHNGRWHPAGPNWPAAVNTDVVSAVVAAEVQCADPAQVSQRWSDITEIPIIGTAPRSLRLDVGEIRFVDATDDRGDGLSAVVLQAADPDRARAAAAARGLLTGDDIALCGVRFRLDH